MARFNLRMPNLSFGRFADLFDRTMLLYVVFTVVLFGVFLVSTFPYEIVVGQALAMMRSNAVNVEFKTAEFAWHRGLALNGVRLSPVEGASLDPYLELNTLWVRPVITQLVRGNPYALAVQADLYGGTAAGQIDLSGAKVAGNLEVKAASLGRYQPLLAVLEEGQVAGRLSGNVSFEATGPSVESGQAKGEMRLENASLEKAKISGFTFPDVHFRESRLTFGVQNGRMEVEQFNANGDELNVSASGQVSFREPLDASVLNLKATFLPGKDAPDNIRGMIALIPKPRDAKPDAPVRISGTLARPRFR